MIDYQRLFHTGFLVPDLRAAMDHYGVAMGLTWAPIRTLAALPVWSADKGLRNVAIEVVYSMDGPHHTEMVTGEPGSPWDPASGRGQHFGLWADDIATETAAWIARGWTVLAAGASPEERYGTYVYLTPPGGGLMIEFVASHLEPSFHRWWAGEDID
jgi:hypothetical protein